MTDWDLLARKSGFSGEKELLTVLYIDHNFSTAQIAIMLQVTRQNVCQRLSRHGIVRRSRGGANNVKDMEEVIHLYDQREVWHHPKELAKALNISLSTIYRLRKELL